MNLVDKENKLNKLKQILQEYIAKSESADDDSPFVINSQEQAKIDPEPSQIFYFLLCPAITSCVQLFPDIS